MTKCMVFINYAPVGWEKMIDHDLDRGSAMTKIIEGLGGKVDGLYWMPTHYDAVAIIDMPSLDDAQALCNLIYSQGAVRTIEVHPVITNSEHGRILRRAREMKEHYKPAHHEAAHEHKHPVPA